MQRWFAVWILCLLPLGSAAADTVFDFTYTGSLYTAIGTLTAVANGDGSFTAVSGSGVYDGFAITLIPDPGAPGVATSPSGGFNYDDQLFPSQSSVLDLDGLLFSINGLGATELNICANPGCDNGGAYDSILNNGTYPASTDSGIFILTAVPEPSAWVFPGFAFLGLVMVRRRISRPAQLN